MAGFIRYQLTMFRKHPDLIPLAVAVGCAATGGTLAAIRAATKYPDVSWDRKRNPEPWNHIKQNQSVKFFRTPNHDYTTAKFPKERPSMATETYKDI